MNELHDSVLTKIYRTEENIDGYHIKEVIFRNNITHFMGLHDKINKCRFRSYYVDDKIFSEGADIKDILTKKITKTDTGYCCDEERYYDHEGRLLSTPMYNFEYIPNTSIIKNVHVNNLYSRNLEISLADDGSITDVFSKWIPLTCNYNYINGKKRLVCCSSANKNSPIESFIYDKNDNLISIIQYHEGCRHSLRKYNVIY